jgi:hypothetical protein
MRRFVILILVLGLVATACNRGDDAELTTTTTVSSSPSQTSTTSTDSGPDGETTTTLATGAPPEYQIIAGNSGEGEYVVLIDPGAYSEQDLRNIMEVMVDEYAPVTVHLIDSEEASELVLIDEVTEAEQGILDAHYFARIVDGTTLEFLGPYSDLDPVYIGS